MTPTRQAGRELDAEVAERVMGWKYVEGTGTDRTVHFLHPQIISCDSMKGAIRPTRRRSARAARNAPPYSTNIADAWAIVEALWDAGWNVDVSLYAAWNAPNFQNGERMYRCAAESRRKRDTAVIEWAATVPLAICLAALKAVGAEASAWAPPVKPPLSPNSVCCARQMPRPCAWDGSGCIAGHLGVRE